MTCTAHLGNCRAATVPWPSLRVVPTNGANGTVPTNWVVSGLASGESDVIEVFHLPNEQDADPLRLTFVRAFPNGKFQVMVAHPSVRIGDRVLIRLVHHNANDEVDWSEDLGVVQLGDEPDPPLDPNAVTVDSAAWNSCLRGAAAGFRRSTGDATSTRLMAAGVERQCAVHAIADVHLHFPRAAVMRGELDASTYARALRTALARRAARTVEMRAN